MLGYVHKLFVSKSLLTMPSNVLHLHLKQTFPPKIWFFTESEGDGIESRLLFKIFSTLPIIRIFFQNCNTLHHVDWWTVCGQRIRKKLFPPGITNTLVVLLCMCVCWKLVVSLRDGLQWMSCIYAVYCEKQMDSF